MKCWKILFVVFITAALSFHGKHPGVRISLAADDLVPKFVAFYDSSRKEHADESRRWQLWKKMVDFEATPPTPAGDSIARYYLDLSWPRYDSLVPYLRSGLSMKIFKQASGVVEKIAKILKPDTAFSIRIKTYVGGFEPNAFTTVSNRKIITSLPVEIPDSVRYPIMIHELVHAVHIGMGSFSGGWHRTIGTIVITEGLAMRVSQILTPGKPDSAYTEYSTGWYRMAVAKKTEILQDVRRVAYSDSLNDIMQFTMGQGPAGLEREAYYAGWLVVGFLLQHGKSASEIARIPEKDMPAITMKIIDSILEKDIDSISVWNQLNEFVISFENLDFDRFQAVFSNDVTIFFPPSARVNYRVEGKENAMKVFKEFFKKVKEGKSNPPYLDISPKKLKMTLIQDVAVVTFELEDNNAISRRTIIFRKENGRFLIFHLHASKMDNPK